MIYKNFTRHIPLILVATLLISSLSGCATIVNGTSQKIRVTSDPSGAVLVVDGRDSYTTPVKLRLERRRDHLLEFSKEGYEGQKIKLMHVISEVVVGNTLLGGPVGWVFDIFAGSQYKLVPNPVHAELKKNPVPE